MRSFIVCVAVLLLPVRSVSAGIQGRWVGAFSRLGSTQSLAVEFVQSDSGWSGTYDIPDLILYREPLTEVTVWPDSLAFRLFWGRFHCVLHPEIGEITGVNPNWGPPVSIHLRRSLQEDLFRIETVRFSSDSTSLSGDLLIPNGTPPFPAIVIIEGSTTAGRALWSYRSLGDLFARNGIAALVYDKRGTGQSAEEAATATFQDLADDAAAAARYVQGRPEVDPSAVGFLGISQGGWLAPLAARQCPELAFLILFVGPAVSVWDQERHRVEYSMKAGSLGEDEPDRFSTEEIAAALKHTELGFAVAQQPERWGEWKSSVAAAEASRWAAYVALDSSIEELQGWQRQEYDPSETLSRTSLPLLALFGAEDVLVPPEENVPRLTTLLSAAENDDVTVMEFPEVGHSLIRNGTLVGGEWEWPTGFWRWTRRAPGVADSLVLWTRRHTGR